MINKNLLLLISCLILLASCGSPTIKKVNNNRREIVEQVDRKSGEAINVELGVGYLKRGKEGDIDIALEKFKKAVSMNPKYALAHSMLATVYDQKGLFENAEIHYKQSYKLNNGSPDIINNYANFLCQRGKYELAVEKYMLVVDDPQYKTPEAAYENAGICSSKAHNVKLAETYFRKALEINKKMPNSLYYLMKIYLDENNYMKSRAFLQRLEQVVIQPSPEMLAAGYNIEKALNQKKMAQKYLTTLKNRYPHSDSLKDIK